MFFAVVMCESVVAIAPVIPACGPATGSGRAERSPGKPAKHERRILAAEAEAVRERHVELPFARFIRNVVEVAVRVGISRLIVGGMTPSRMASRQTIASTAPPAATRCPVMLLVLETGIS